MHVPRERRCAPLLCLGLCGGVLAVSGCSTLVPSDGYRGLTSWLRTPGSDVGEDQPAEEAAPAPATPRTVASANSTTATIGTALEDAPAGGRPRPAAGLADPPPAPDPLSPRVPPRSAGGDHVAPLPPGQPPLLPLLSPNAPAGTPADEPARGEPPLTTAEILEYTLHHHPALRVRRGEVEAAQAALITAGLRPNPEFVLDADTDINGGSNREELTARLMLTLPLGPQRRLQCAAAQMEVQQRQTAVSREIRSLLAEATDAAVEVLYWQEMAAVERSLRELSAQAAEIQKERFRIGAVPYRTAVATEMAVTECVAAERAILVKLRTAQMRLAHAMGGDFSQPIAVSGTLTIEPLPTLALETVLAEARQAAPELMAARAAIGKSQEQLALERWKRLPDIKLGPRYQDVLADRADRVGGRVAVDVPLFDRNQGNVALRAAELETNRALLQLAQLETEGDVAATWFELRAVYANLEYYAHHVLPLAERTENAIREAFRDQTLGANEVVDLLQQFGKMRRNHLDLRWEYVRRRAALEILLGRGLSELN